MHGRGEGWWQAGDGQCLGVLPGKDIGCILDISDLVRMLSFLGKNGACANIVGRRFQRIHKAFRKEVLDIGVDEDIGKRRCGIGHITRSDELGQDGSNQLVDPRPSWR